MSNDRMMVVRHRGWVEQSVHSEWSGDDLQKASFNC